MFYTKERIKKIGLNVREQLKEPYYSGVAAELAFFLLLSIVPTVILIGKFSGLFSVSAQYLVETLNLYAPKELNQLITPYLQAEGSNNTSIIFLVLSLWFASTGFNALIRISNYAYEIEKRKIGFLFKRIKAIRVTFLFMIMVVVNLMVVVYGQIIGEFITNYSKELFGIGIIIDTIWYFLRWPISFVFFYILMLYIYSSLPDKHLPYSKVMPGAIFATLGITAASSVFTIYVSKLSKYDLIYGSLSNIVILMFWLYIISFVIVNGIIINIAIERVKKSEQEENN